MALSTSLGRGQPGSPGEVRGCGGDLAPSSGPDLLSADTWCVHLCHGEGVPSSPKLLGSNVQGKNGGLGCAEGAQETKLTTNTGEATEY